MVNVPDPLGQEEVSLHAFHRIVVRCYHLRNGTNTSTAYTGLNRAY